jgi:hypothetical protein
LIRIGIEFFPHGSVQSACVRETFHISGFVGGIKASKVAKLHRNRTWSAMESCGDSNYIRIIAMKFAEGSTAVEVKAN